MDRKEFEEFIRPPLERKPMELPIIISYRLEALVDKIMDVKYEMSKDSYEWQYKKHKESLKELTDDLEKMLPRLSYTLKNNQLIMEKMIRACPRAYLYIGDNLKNNEFLLAALEENHEVYLLLPENQKSDKDVVDVYRRCFPWKTKSLDPSVDPKLFYTIEEYTKCCADVLTNGEYVYLGGHGKNYYETKLSDSALFISSADKELQEVTDQYQNIKVNMIRDRADELCNRVLTNHYIGEDVLRFIKKNVPDFQKSYLNPYIEKHLEELKNEKCAQPFIKEYEKASGLLKESFEQTTTHEQAGQLDSVDEFIEFIDQNREAVSQAIDDGRISMQGILDVIGQKYDVSVANQERQSVGDCGPKPIKENDSHEIVL